MKFKPEEKGDQQVEAIMAFPNTLMEVQKSLNEIGEFFDNFNFQVR